MPLGSRLEFASASLKSSSTVMVVLTSVAVSGGVTCATVGKCFIEHDVTEVYCLIVRGDVGVAEREAAEVGIGDLRLERADRHRPDREQSVAQRARIDAARQPAL